MALKYDIAINDRFGVGSEENLARHIFQILQSGDACGQLILVCWKHTDIPVLSQSLGCSPLQGCPLDFPSLEFDAVFEIKYLYDVPSFGLPQAKAEDEPTGKAQYNTWKVFGNVQHEGFDPLAYSKHAGDYPYGGTERAGRWIEDMISAEEYMKDKRKRSQN